MCTVTFWPGKRGYLLGMNRDEQRSRVAGLAPSMCEVDGMRILQPSEPSGGTWISASEIGVSVALINWYSVKVRPTEHPLSRGAVVLAARSACSRAEAQVRLFGLPLERIRPFRLLGVFEREGMVQEWRWNGEALASAQHPWAAGVWISSGFDEPGAQRIRGNTFSHALQEMDAGSTAWLRRFHASHLPEPGPYVVCMHREDAATVSYTEVEVDGGRVEMRYLDKSLCCRRDADLQTLSLDAVSRLGAVATP